MKKAMKLLVTVLAFVMASAVFFAACTNRDDDGDPSIVDPPKESNLSAENEEAVEAMVGMAVGALSAMLANPDTGAVPEFVGLITDTAAEKVIAAIEAAGITNGEIEDLLDIIGQIMQAEPQTPPVDEDDPGEAEVDPAMLALMEAIIDFDLSNTKISYFLWHLADGAEEIVNAMNEDSAFEGVKEYYDDVMDLGEEEFVAAVNAVLSISRSDGTAVLDALGLTYGDIIADPEMNIFEGITEDEFKDVVLTMKSEAISIFKDVLGDKAVSGLVGFAKIFLPLIPFPSEDAGFANELIAQIEYVESRFSALRNTVVAALNAVNGSMADAIYNADFSGEGDADSVSVNMIAIGKMGHAAINASKGITKEIIAEIVGMANGGVASDEDLAEIDAMYEAAKKDLAWLNGRAYTYTITLTDLADKPFAQLLYGVVSGEGASGEIPEGYAA